MPSATSPHLLTPPSFPPPHATPRSPCPRLPFRRALRDPFSLLDTLGKDDFYGLQPLLRRALQATDLAGPVMEGLGGFKVDVMEVRTLLACQGGWGSGVRGGLLWCNVAGWPSLHPTTTPS